jgi:hypothetical protein
MEEVDAEKLGALSLEDEVQEAGEQGADEESDGGQLSDDEEDEDPGPEDEVKFEAWLRCEMEKMPLFKAFAETFDKAILAVQRPSPGMDAPHTRADAIRCRPKTNSPPTPPGPGLAQALLREPAALEAHLEAHKGDQRGRGVGPGGQTGPARPAVARRTPRAPRPLTPPYPGDCLLRERDGRARGPPAGAPAPAQPSAALPPAACAAIARVLSAPGRRAQGRVTIVDLCSGKGYLSMLLSEILPRDKARPCVPTSPQPRPAAPAARGAGPRGGRRPRARAPSSPPRVSPAEQASTRVTTAARREAAAA